LGNVDRTKQLLNSLKTTYSNLPIAQQARGMLKML